MKDLRIETCVVGYVSTNCYLAVNVETEELIFVDPGAEAEKLIRAAERTGAKPVGILLTHGHFDHIMAVEALKKQYDIPVYASSQEADMLAKPHVNMTDIYGGNVSLTAEHLLEDEEDFELASFRIRCLHTPGHTVGSCCFYLPEEGVLFSGDTLFFRSVGRTDFPNGSTAQIIASLHRLLEDLPADTIVYPGHDNLTTIGDEARYNPFV